MLMQTLFPLKSYPDILISPHNSSELATSLFLKKIHLLPLSLFQTLWFSLSPLSFRCFDLEMMAFSFLIYRFVGLKESRKHVASVLSIENVYEIAIVILAWFTQTWKTYP
ncbi:hypothetical protein MANES_01G151650v8 [Manihot esculenta]|uniref:Uncharacterized protein n=1 Tax=Manihot esculenta TaxID=3983 RepID=A0ACB7IF66_MANES|nr:hypothetical protein MANES_01G151650v8 [Manihot esculenta]